MGCCGWKRADRAPDPLPASTPDTTLLERHRAVAETALVNATGGDPLCRVGDGPDVTGPKFAEGRLAAVAELQRTCRAAVGSDTEVLAHQTLARWQDEQRNSRVRSPAWDAYREGGIAELTSVVEELRGVTTGTSG